MRTVFAVVPTFEPDLHVLERLSLLAVQVKHLIVVDDGSSAAASATLADIEKQGHELIRLPKNGGIAAALNTGIRVALARGADYVLTLDQDSVLGDGYVAACLRAFESTVQATHLGVILSDRINGQPAIPARFSPEGLGLVDEGIQSGAMISAGCLRSAGLMDERLVIDCVDTEYCLRVADHGFRLAVAPGTDMEHALGEMVPLRPFGLHNQHDVQTRLYQYHSPFRQYYITRNNIDLVLRNFRSRRRWTLAVVKRQIGPTYNAVTSGPHRAKHFVAVVVGAAHGIARVRGPIPPGLLRFLRP